MYLFLATVQLTFCGPQYPFRKERQAYVLPRDDGSHSPHQLREMVHQHVQKNFFRRRLTNTNKQRDGGQGETKGAKQKQRKEGHARQNQQLVQVAPGLYATVQALSTLTV